MNAHVIRDNQHPFKAPKKVHTDQNWTVGCQRYLAGAILRFITDRNFCRLEDDFLQSTVGKTCFAYRIRRHK